MKVRMSLNIKNDETCLLARDLARPTRAIPAIPG